MNDLQIIKGIECFTDESGMIQLKLENVARGLGFTQVKNNIIYIRWETVKGYLNGFGFSQDVGKDSFIPEPIFYMLAMKAESEPAKRFQKIVAYEILPEIRKTGTYSVPEMSKELKSIFILDRRTMALDSRMDNLEDNMTIDHGQAVVIKHLVDITVKRLCCGSESNAYLNKKLRSQIYLYTWRSIKEYFNVTAYHNLLRKDMDKAMNYIKSLGLQGLLLREVQNSNSQMSFVKDAV